ncbi:MAG: hypothetical protein AAFS04_15400 [Cyanobacteria bacterium J06631_9]
MTAADIVSAGLLLFGVLLGPVIFVASVVAYGTKRAVSMWKVYQERRYVRSHPCGNCRYFTNGDFLKCAVNPIAVLTEDARSCHDFAAIAPCDDPNDDSYYLGLSKYRYSSDRAAK